MCYIPCALSFLESPELDPYQYCAREQHVTRYDCYMLTACACHLQSDPSNVRGTRN
ncbi:hypothetical protein J6590_044554 [Homalodisca vitripennis]|nr:hypothetical protein J6590_044554 [Homalodisca vitripennis]